MSCKSHCQLAVLTETVTFLSVVLNSSVMDV